MKNQTNSPAITGPAAQAKKAACQPSAGAMTPAIAYESAVPMPKNEV